MNRRILSKLAIVSFTLLTIFGCGGGGGGGGGAPSPGDGTTPTGPQAVVTLSTQGTLPAGTTIGGVDCTVQLPALVTCKSDATGLTDPSATVASGQAQGGTLVGNFTAASGKVRIAVIKTSGFGIGEFATLNLDITGSTPNASDFSVSGLSVVDFNSGQIINGLTATTTVQFR